MRHEIEFSPISEFTDWLDGVDRVAASGDNGFNVRFRSLQADLETLGSRIGDLNAAINDDRNRLQLGFSVLSNDCVMSGESFRLGAMTNASNDFLFQTGPVIISGIPVAAGFLVSPYSQQPWTDPNQAAADGVPVIPPLTTPQSDRQDRVYLDVWEREIEIDGARRLLQEKAVRVQQGGEQAQFLPDHLYMDLAYLHRKAGVAQITEEQIEDLRVVVDRGPKERTLSPPPLFYPYSGGTLPWDHIHRDDFTLVASKPTGRTAAGVLPIDVPSGGRQLRVSIAGKCNAATDGSMIAYLIRSGDASASVLAEDAVPFPPIGPFVRSLEAPTDVVVDNEEFGYHLLVGAYPGCDVELTQIRVHYLF